MYTKKEDVLKARGYAVPCSWILLVDSSLNTCASTFAGYLRGLEGRHVGMACFRGCPRITRRSDLRITRFDCGLSVDIGLIIGLSLIDSLMIPGLVVYGGSLSVRYTLSISGYFLGKFSRIFS